MTIGASLAPELELERLGWGLLAFFLALGVGAHALDELNGRPLQTRIPTRTLAGLAVVSLVAAAAIGIGAALAWSLPGLLAFVAAGVLLAVGYNLELFGGRLHGDVWFALAWGAFPVLTGYYGAAETIRVEAVLAALAATALSVAQRALSSRVRAVRRRAVSLEGEIVYRDGRREPIDADTLLAAPELALKATAAGVVALAAALAVLRLAV